MHCIDASVLVDSFMEHENQSLNSYREHRMKLTPIPITKAVFITSDHFSFSRHFNPLSCSLNFLIPRAILLASLEFLLPCVLLP